jgi:hypothetical protein
VNINHWFYYQGFLAVLGGFIGGSLLLLPAMWIGKLLPKKIQESELTPIFLGILAGSMGMWLVCNALAGNGWDSCLPFCNK